MASSLVRWGGNKLIFFALGIFLHRLQILCTFQTTLDRWGRGLKTKQKLYPALAELPEPMPP